MFQHVGSADKVIQTPEVLECRTEGSEIRALGESLGFKLGWAGRVERQLREGLLAQVPCVHVWASVLSNYESLIKYLSLQLPLITSSVNGDKSHCEDYPR